MTFVAERRKPSGVGESPPETGGLAPCRYGSYRTEQITMVPFCDSIS